jgi:outer membrane protein TolC
MTRALVLGILLPAVAGAEALRLEEAVRRALAQRPRLQAARLEIDEAREALRGARAAFLPRLHMDGVATVGPGGAHGSLEHLGLAASPFTRNFGASVILSQTIWDFGRSLHRFRAVRHGVTSATAREAEERRALVLAVGLAFFRCTGSARAAQVHENAVLGRRLTLRQARALADARLRPEADAVMAALRLQEAQVEAARARHDLAACLVDLARNLGDEQPPSSLVEPAAAVAVPDPLERLLARALARRPELAALHAALARAEEEVKARWSEHLPVLRGYASGGLARWQSSLIDDQYYSAGLALSVPIFTGYAVDARVRVARLRASKVRAALAEERLRVRGEVAGARERLLGALEVQSRLRTEVQRAAEASRIIRERYRANLAPLLDLQAAELAQTSAEQRLAAAEAAVRAAEWTLRFATGE